MQSGSDIGYFQRSPPEVLLQTLCFQSVQLLKSLKPRLDYPLQRLDNVILRQKPKDLVLGYDSEDEILR